MFGCSKFSIKEKTCQFRKFILIAKFLNHYTKVLKLKEMNLLFLASFTNLNKLANRKMVYRWMGLLANIKCFTKEMGSKVDCFAGFYHHCLATISMPTHVNFYCLFKSGIKTGLWTTPLCRKDTTLLPKYKNNSKNDFSLNNK